PTPGPDAHARVGNLRKLLSIWCFVPCLGTAVGSIQPLTRMIPTDPPGSRAPAGGAPSFVRPETREPPMSTRDWRRWLRTLLPACRTGRAHKPPARRAGRRPLLEVLEGRLVPATVITVVPIGTGSLDGFLSPTDGTITTSDGGNTPGTLSKAALEGV